jgi:hypothetical protein
MLTVLLKTVMNILFTELTPTPQLHPAEFLSRSYHLLAEANHFPYLIEKQIHNHSEKQVSRPCNEPNEYSP